ncbi:MAG TPA: sulfite exporter TauE/SafE family protein [Gemmatimonadales bacterium]|nr:sulfite exporter TauE/SafE family protein [Gemmatimonadales bacterium]
MLVTLIVIGLAAGVLAGLFGIGGGLVIVPALVFFARMPIQVATGTSLGALLLPVGVLGALVYYRAGNLDLRASLIIAGGLFVGAYFGALLSQELKTAALTRLFAVFLALVAARLWMKA